MQWIFMLAGIALGALTGDADDFSAVNALLGGLIGLVLGQAIKLSKLTLSSARQDERMESLARRLALLETAAVAPASGFAPHTPSPLPSEPSPVAAMAPAPLANASPSAVIRPALVWELPVETAVEPAVTAADPWDSGCSQPEQVAATRVVSVSVPVEPDVIAPHGPREPNFIERALVAARGWLFGGNTVLRIGVVLLFLGLAFLLRYATEGMVVPIETRYAGVAGSAIALLALGWWLRYRNPAYALMVQGAGVAVLYLTVFAAMRLHPLLDPGAAFGLLVAVTLFSAILAVTQNARSLAVVAALGGFAAPILTSTGQGSHVGLFSYFALLNAGIFAIAWFKAWRVLNLVGFVGTFGIGFAWGLKLYTPEMLASTEPFLILFFSMYLAIGLLFARRTLREQAKGPADDSRAALLHWSARQGNYVDGSILFGTPLVGFGLQCALVHSIEFAAAYSALALGLVYLGLARLLAGRAPGRALLLVETCLALGVIFASLAIPLGFDARWTASAWAVEGAGLYWLGLRQRRPLARAFALLLQLGSALSFLSILRVGGDTLLDGSWLGALMLGAALLFSFLQLRQAPEDQARTLERRALPWLACLGLGFLYLIAPLNLRGQNTAIVWALAGLVTLFSGLRLQSRSFLFSGFVVQLVGGGVFLAQLHGAGSGSAIFGAGWAGLLGASLIGISLIGGMLLAARDPLVRNDPHLLRAMSLLLLIGLVFINLAVLFVLPWRTASAVWAGSGLIIIWLSLHLQQRASFLFGLVLQGVGGASFLLAGPLLMQALPGDGVRPFAHAGFWTPLVLALAALVGSWRLQQVARRVGVAVAPVVLGSASLLRLSNVLLVWGLGWWAMAFAGEVLRFVAPASVIPALLGLIALSVGLATWLAARLRWAGLALASSLMIASTLLVPAFAVVLIGAWSSSYHPFGSHGWLAWVAVFAVHFWSLRRLAALLPEPMLRATHVLGCWLIIGVLALETRCAMALLAEHDNAWRWLGWALVPSLYLLAMAARRDWPWPVRAFPNDYRLRAAAPLAVLMLGWFWIANIVSDGSAEPLPYLPLLNPLELGLGLALLSVMVWLRAQLPATGFGPLTREQVLQGVAGPSLFVLFTAVVMRGVHHWGHVPYELDALLESMQVQAGLSLVWTLIALALMIAGHLRLRREVWLVGAVLIGVVVTKLFFVELSNRGGLERIVSFIGVGILLLIVGYFAPLPPKSDAPEEVEPEVEQVGP